MDIPNDLNKLLARLKEVTTVTSRTQEAWASGPRPSAVEIDFFLGQYHFDADARDRTDRDLKGWHLRVLHIRSLEQLQ